MEESIAKQVIAKENNNEKTLKKSLLFFFFKITKEIISVLFWLYLIIKMFIFDLDVFLIKNYVSNYYWIIEYKFLIIISIIAVCWFFTKNKNILIWFLYISFYPFVLMFWKIPFFIFKQKSWIFAFAVINSIISFFKSIKYKFIISTIYILSLSGIFLFTNNKIIGLSSLFIILTLSIVHIRSLILVFKPSSIFQIYIKIFSGMRNHGKSFFGIDDDMKDLAVNDFGEKQLEKWTTNLQTSILFNRVCLFSAKKLKAYQNSKLNAVSSIFTIFGLIILTIISFAVVNYGIFKIDNGYFELSTIPSFFIFIYYSFNSIFFNSIKEITPTLPLSQILFMIESFFAFFIVAIFISLIFTYKNQKRTEELNQAIEGIEGEAKSMEGFIKEEFRFKNIDEAIKELSNLKSGLAQFILKITESIR